MVNYFRAASSQSHPDLHKLAHSLCVKNVAPNCCGSEHTSIYFGDEPLETGCIDGKIVHNFPRQSIHDLEKELGGIGYKMQIKPTTLEDGSVFNSLEIYVRTENNHHQTDLTMEEVRHLISHHGMDFVDYSASGKTRAIRNKFRFWKRTDRLLYGAMTYERETITVSMDETGQYVSMKGTATENPRISRALDAVVKHLFKKPLTVGI
ncbi:MAG: hypothetical protein AABX34_03540 [Nanoarchaeota archaeon]